MSRDFAKQFAAFAAEEAKPAPKHDPRTIALFAATLRNFLRTDAGRKTVDVAMLSGFATAGAGASAANAAMLLTGKLGYMLPGLACALGAGMAALGFLKNMPGEQLTRGLIMKLDAIARRGSAEQAIGRLVEIQPDDPKVSVHFPGDQESLEEASGVKV